MTKIIHCIKVGGIDLGDFELSCVDSWKRTYPDFEIKYWADEDILPLISDCRYAVSCYNNRKFGYVSDYVRLKILKEYGGLYMDTDVFAVNRIPDACFQKSFTAWDSGFDTYWSQTGTCLYAAKPNEPIIDRFIDLYRSFKEYPEHVSDNTVVEFILRRLGVDWADRTTCQFTNQHLNEIDIYNCVQFGAFDYTQNLMWALPDVPIYLVHARAKSWAGYSDEGIYLYYALVNEDTDMMQLYDMTHRFAEMEIKNGIKAVLVLGLNTVSGKTNWISKWLNLRLKSDRGYLVAPLGNGMGEEELNAAFLDFVSKRFNKIRFCRDIMDGKFTGTLTV